MATIVSYQVRSEYSAHADGPARMLANELGVQKISSHTWAGGEIVTHVVAANDQVVRVDGFGHAASGLCDPSAHWNLNPAFARRMAGNMADGSLVVNHGCGTRSGKYFNTEAFLTLLPSGSLLYNHFNYAGPGQPHNWVRHRMQSGTLDSKRLEGSDSVVDTFLPRAYVAKWALKQKPADLQRTMSDPRNSVTDDVREVFRGVIERRITASTESHPLGDALDGAPDEPILVLWSPDRCPVDDCEMS